MTTIALAADFAIIVAAATVMGLIARQLGQPTIVAYLATGLVLGPVMFDVVTAEGLVELMAELGLGFLLFLLGIKMRLDDIREILRPVINIAVLQTVLQTALAFGVAYVLGFSMTETVVIALATVFGATPIIVKVLTDKDEITTLPGKIDVGVLIIQDIYLVIVLAMFSAENIANPREIGVTLLVVLGMMVAIGFIAIASSRYVLPRLFKTIADKKDVFFLLGIAWAFVFILVTEHFNLSVEVGAFLAGLSIAQLPYSTELEERIAPLTDFFILVFFSSIGLHLAADDLLAYWVEAVIASIILLVGNFWIMFYLIDREKFSVETSFLGSINMIQVSEFSLVVGGLALAQGFIDAQVLGFLSLMALGTMTFSTYVITYNNEIYDRVRPFFSRWESEEKRDVALRTYEGHAVAIGYDEITRRVLPLLDEHFDDVIVIDRRTDHVDTLKAAGFDVIYGDLRHREVRKAANLAKASFVLSSSAQTEINARLIDETADDALVFMEAENHKDAVRMYEAGADYVIMPASLTVQSLIGLLEAYREGRETLESKLEDAHEKLRGNPLG